MTTTSAPELPAPARLSRKQRRAKRARESISSIPLSQPSPPSQPGPSKRPRLSRAPRNEALLAAQDPIPSEADDPPNETPSSSDYERLSFDEEPSSPLHEDGEVEPSSQPPLKKGKKKKKKKGKPSKPKPFSEPVSDPVAWLESKVLIEPEVRAKFEEDVRAEIHDTVLLEMVFAMAPVVDWSIVNAMLTRYQVKDEKRSYRVWATKRDKAHTRSFSSKKSPPLITFHRDSLPKEIRLLDEPKGFFITDNWGVPLVFVLRGLISPELHEAIIRKGIQFSRDFKQMGGHYRDGYKDLSKETPPTESEFTNCQAHYGIWNPTGQDSDWPVISADTRHNHELWEDFFNSEPIQIVLRIINMVLERLDPEFVKALRALKAAIQGKKGGKQFLMGNPCHLINLAVHYNQEGTRHTDSKSLHSGWDPMVAFGRYVGCKMKWPALETKFMVHPTDFTFGRGAGFMHQALEWRGGGRMVLVPFVDRRLFGYQSMARPQQFQPFYWKDQHGLKSAIPPKPLRWD